MITKTPHDKTTVPLAILACLLWSTAFVGIKVGLRYASPWFFAGTRFLLSGLLLFPLSGGLKNIRSDFRQHGKTIMIVALLQTFLLYGLFYTGMTLVDGALAAIIIGASPLVSAVLAHHYMEGDKQNPKRMISLIVGFGGVVLISLSRAPWSAAGFRETLGIGILLLGSTCAAGANIIVAKSGKGMKPMRLSALQFTLGGVALILLSRFTESWPVLPLPGVYWAAFLWLSFMSAAAMSIWFILLRRPGVKVSELNIWKFIMPVFGAALAWTFLPGESPALLPVLGMVLVALSVLGYFRVQQ